MPSVITNLLNCNNLVDLRIRLVNTILLVQDTIAIGTAGSTPKQLSISYFNDLRLHINRLSNRDLSSLRSDLNNGLITQNYYNREKSAILNQVRDRRLELDTLKSDTLDYIDNPQLITNSLDSTQDDDNTVD
jgi:hypothetical protein